MTAGRLLARGMLVGVAAALLAFVVARLLGESQVGYAVAFEQASARAAGAAPEPVLVSRTVQSTLGLAVALLAFSVAIGGVFALAYACVQGRLGTLGARATAALVALGGFVSLYVVPSLKYPADPPAIGSPDTIGRRTGLYFCMLGISALVVVGTALAARRLSERFDPWDAAVLAGLGGVVVLAVCCRVLPSFSETPAGFPADVLWRFRVASLAVQATVWATVGLLFGALTERSLRAAQQGAADPGRLSGLRSR